MGESNEFWKVVEVEAMKINKDENSAIIFVCSAKNADLIYEYSYKENRNPSAIMNLIWGMTLSIFPTMEKRNYEVELKVKDKNNKIIQEIGNTNFDHTIFISSSFIPVQIITRKNLFSENVIAEIVLDKVFESLNSLEWPIEKNNKKTKL
jgi:hypothetical protein